MMKGTIKIECEKQKAEIIMTMHNNEEVKVDCKFIPTLDITKEPTMAENFVANVAKIIILYMNEVQ